MMQEYHTSWNYVNIIAAAFLLLLVLSLVFFAAFQTVQGQQPDPSNAGDKINTSDLNEINKERERLKALESQLLEKEQKLADLEKQLNQQEETLKSLVDVRTEIIRELVEKFSQSNLILDIDSQTGAIRFSDGIFFDSGMDRIKKNGADYLKQFIPAYFSIILNDKNRDYIAEIIIEGHTDDVGSYIYNLDLSQRRAFAVARYILEEDIPGFEYKDIIHAYLTANGRSYSQPIMTGGIIDREKSRRVEFKFRLKDEETIKEMQQIFERTN
ncbi:MAG TPA: OmpA family protein [Clostridiales bacterium]|nr:OmpA family protein [Clostridiales bacterium]